MNKILVSILCAGLFFSASAQADEKVLAAEEAQALFSNKTFDGINEESGKPFKVYSAEDGAHTVKFANGKIKEGTWRIDDKGRHCVSFKNKKGCTKVVATGDGVYEKHRGDDHTHTLKNFVDGNQL